MQEPEESNLVSKGPCAACGSSDACAAYDDGHTHCFSCGAHSSGSGSTTSHTKAPRMFDALIGGVQALPKRGLSEATCAKFGYKVGQTRAGRKVHIADYRDAAGDVVAQHTRDSEKQFAWLGDAKSVTLWGQHLWSGTGRRVVVTEGEIDAMSVAQALGLTWPVVSIPNGAQGAKKAIQRNLEFLEGYDEIVLWFDDDEPGREATAECAALFSPGKCKIAIAGEGLKDANDVLLKHGVKTVGARAQWEAKEYRPDGIVDLKDLRARVLEMPKMGYAWPWPSLTARTHGRRLGDVIGIGAAVGAGKSDFVTDCIAHDVMELGLVTGVLSFEQDVGDTGRRVCGKIAGKRFHVPDGKSTPEELAAAFDALEAAGNFYLYDNFGVTDWDTIEAKIRFMVASLGCQSIWLDNLTALIAGASDERRELDRIMARAAGMAKSLGFIFHYVSHLATPDGTPHEEGGRVMGKHFHGSRSIIRWSHVVLGLERNQQASTVEPTVVRVLKDRLAGDGTGKTFGLSYSFETGRLTETPLELEGSEMTSDECPF